jgi:hypothetical protein
MAELVLDRVQLFLRENRADASDHPPVRGRKIFVDPAGRIRFGDSVPDDDRPGLAEVRQNVFA